MKWKIVVALVVAYGVTWVGGWIAHDREIAARAQRMYDDARQRDQELAARFHEQGIDPGDTFTDHISRSGPSTGVKWCVPVLPGVLVADSWYIIGPLWGEGGVEIVVYYGFGAADVRMVSSRVAQA